MPSVAVNPELLRWAIDRSGLPVDELRGQFKKINEWQELKIQQRKKKSGGNFYATQGVRLGRRFSSAVVRAAREGRILYQDAFRLTGKKGKTFHTFADQVRQRVRNGTLVCGNSNSGKPGVHFQRTTVREKKLW